MLIWCTPRRQHYVSGVVGVSQSMQPADRLLAWLLSSNIMKSLLCAMHAVLEAPSQIPGLTDGAATAPQEHTSSASKAINWFQQWCVRLHFVALHCNASVLCTCMDRWRCTLSGHSTCSNSCAGMPCSTPVCDYPQSHVAAARCCSQALLVELGSQSARAELHSL